LIERTRADFAYDHASGATAQSFFHRPEHIAAARSSHRDQLFWSNTEVDKAWAVRGAILKQAKIFGYPQCDVCASGPVARVRVPMGLLEQNCREAQHKARRGGDIRFMAC
jgi:hypothetical protein